MDKPTKYKNCSICAKRGDCWDTKRYGERGERGKRPFPCEAVCSLFVIDKPKDWEAQ